MDILSQMTARAKVGKTYVRKGKTREHRFIDFLRRVIMLEMSGGCEK